MSDELNLQAERKAFEAAAATLNIPPTSMAGFELWLAARSTPQGVLTEALPELPPMPRRTIIYPDSDDRCYALAFTESQMHAYARQYAAQCIEARNQQATLTDAQIAAGAAISCDHGTPIGRNAAISVYDAMGGSQGGDALDAARYRLLRDQMCFTTEPGQTPTVAWGGMPAPEHDPHKDWVGDRFSASVDRTIDAAIEQRKADKKGTV